MKKKKKEKFGLIGRTLQYKACVYLINKFSKLFLWVFVEILMLD